MSRRLFPRVGLVVLAVVVASIVVQAAAAGTTPPLTARVGGGVASAPAPAAPSLPDATLYDQNNNDGGNGYISSSFYDTQAADDFVVPASASWHISSVFTSGSDLADLTSVTVTIYSDSSGSPGSQVYSVTVPSGSFTDDPGMFGYPGGNLTIPIDATLASGHYWLSVQGDGDLYYWEIRNVVSNDAAMWQNPDDFFGMGCTSWGDLSTCFGTQNGPPGSLDLMFSLSGTTSPVYAGTPGQTNCVGKTVSVLSEEYNGDLSAAAQALGFNSVKAMQQNIKQYCSGP